MLSLKRVIAAPWVRKSIGVLAAEYLRLVWKTSRLVVDPPDFYEQIGSSVPFIAAMWHGQHFLMPFLLRDSLRAKVLISRHRDGEINAVTVQRFDIEPIRGSGTHGSDIHRKGGASGFKKMLEALAQGYIMALTADVPKVSRVAGRGIVMLARASGRPIYPIALVTSRRFNLDNWDRSTVNLPFSRAAMVAGEPIVVAACADKAAVEAARCAVEQRLNDAFARAYAIVDRRA